MKGYFIPLHTVPDHTNAQKYLVSTGEATPIAQNCTGKGCIFCKFLCLLQHIAWKRLHNPGLTKTFMQINNL